MNFGETIQYYRKRNDLTQQALADLCMVSLGYISKIEGGALNIPPSDAMIEALAYHLAIDPEPLYVLLGKADAKVLRERILEYPDVGVIVRAIQQGKYTKSQINRMLAILRE